MIPLTRPHNLSNLDEALSNFNNLVQTGAKSSLVNKLLTQRWLIRGMNGHLLHLNKFRTIKSSLILWHYPYVMVIDTEKQPWPVYD